MLRQKYGGQIQITEKVSKKIVYTGTVKEVVSYIQKNIKEDFCKSNNSLTTQISNAVRNGTLLFRKYEVAELQIVKNIIPNNNSVPECFMQVVKLSNEKMLNEQKILEKYKRLFPNDKNIINCQINLIEQLKICDFEVFKLKWNEKAKAYQKM